MIMGRRSPGNATLRLVAFISIAVFVITLYLFTSKPELLGRVGKNINEASASWRHSGNDRITRPDESPIRKALVAASVKGNDVSWMHDFFPDWQPNIYVMNDPTANLTVKENKGNEAAAYLTYIIDNYDNLPDVMVFIHALRYQWHNEDPMYDHVPVLRNLSLAHVFENGYVSLRCTWDVGCPAEMYPVGDDAPDFDPHWPFVNMRKAYGKGFKALFPDTPLPERVGAPCCSQFAVTKASVRMRSLEDYERYRRWLWETDMESMISGRIMEYVWHIMMGKPAVLCPPAGECFCQKYGLCNLDCSEGSCAGRYFLPPLNQAIPKNWPVEGQGTHGFPSDGWWNDGKEI